MSVVPPPMSTTLLYQMNFAGLRPVRRIHNGPFLNLRNLTRNANHNARMHHALAVVMCLHDEVIQHLLGVAEVRDHTVLHRLDGDNVARSSSQHLLGFFADGLHLIGLRIDGNDRRLVDDDALATRVHQRVGRAQVDRQIVRKQAEQRPHVVNTRVTRLITVGGHVPISFPE
jgi:hypothetical protein